MSAPAWLRWTVIGLASVGFAGFLPYKIVPHEKWKGSGLLGSLAGWGALWFLPVEGPRFWLLLGFMIVISIPISHWAEKWLTHDDPRIVIDEVAGVWLASLGVPRTAVPMVAALILFRVFDVWKGPWGRTSARAPGGLGVVADDLAAGLITLALVHGGLRLFH